MFPFAAGIGYHTWTSRNIRNWRCTVAGQRSNVTLEGSIYINTTHYTLSSQISTFSNLRSCDSHSGKHGDSDRSKRLKRRNVDCNSLQILQRSSRKEFIENCFHLKIWFWNPSKGMKIWWWFSSSNTFLCVWKIFEPRTMPSKERQGWINEKGAQRRWLGDICWDLPPPEPKKKHVTESFAVTGILGGGSIPRYMFFFRQRWVVQSLKGSKIVCVGHLRVAVDSYHDLSTYLPGVLYKR